MAVLIAKVEHFSSAGPFSEGYPVTIRHDKMIAAKDSMSVSWKESPKMSVVRYKTRFKLSKVPQPPPAYPGAPPDSDRARRPRLVEPAPGGEALDRGDRVERLAAFGKPTGKLGTVEKTNEDDALVKWDADGRTRLHQPWLRKI